VWQPYKKECEWKQDRHKIVKTPRCLLEIYLLMEEHGAAEPQPKKITPRRKEEHEEK